MALSDFIGKKRKLWTEYHFKALWNNVPKKDNTGNGKQINKSKHGLSEENSSLARMIPEEGELPLDRAGMSDYEHTALKRQDAIVKYSCQRASESVNADNMENTPPQKQLRIVSTMETEERLAPSSWALGSRKQNGKVPLKSAQVIKSLLVLVLSRGGGWLLHLFI